MYKSIDLTGKRFGNLIAVEPTDLREDGYVIWHCKCDCGGECYVSSKRLKRGTITNCGCIPKKVDCSPLNLTGEKYGHLKVIRRVENIKERTAWLCKCDCGNEIVVTTHDLRAGHTKSCGCLSHSNPFFIDLTGQRFGFLTVIRKTDKRDHKGSIMWECHCDCGKDVIYSADSLLHSQIKSCGCYRDNEIKKNIHKQLHFIDGTCIERLNIQTARSDCKSGHVGVQKINDSRYRASIGFKGRHYYLGTYSTLNAAVEARERGSKIHINFLNLYHEKDSDLKQHL